MGPRGLLRLSSPCGGPLTLQEWQQGAFPWHPTLLMPQCLLPTAEPWRHVSTAPEALQALLPQSQTLRAGRLQPGPALRGQRSPVRL